MDLRPTTFAFACLLLGSAMLLPGQGKKPTGAQAKPAAKAPAKPTYAQHFQPVLKGVCSGCHGGAKPAGGVSFAGLMTEAKAVQSKALLQKVARNVASGAMPPGGMPAKRKRLFLEWIDMALAGECEIKDAGRVTIRRLNRAEYNNTIRDLLLVDFTPADDFPSDDVGYGFDNIGDVLSVSPLLMEKYLRAAEQIAARAIVVPGSSVKRYDGQNLKPTGGANPSGADDWILFTNGELHVEHDFSRDGSYRIKVRAFGHQAGDAPVQMSIGLGGKLLQLLDVRAEINQPADYEIPVNVKRGRQTIAVGFTNDFFQPNLPEGRRDRNLIVMHVEVLGPMQGASILPASHLRIIPATPPKDRRFETARQYLARFATRAYRRPAKPNEIDRLMLIFKAVDAQGETFERAMQVCVQAVLVSPHFLFRVEQDAPGAKGNQPLSDYELASRLSYFLWSSCPDDLLLDLARQGKLRQPATLKAQVARMLKDKRAPEALCDNFAAQWLQLRKLEIVHPDPKEFAGFNDRLKKDMLAETEAFFKHIVTADRPILDFLDARYSFLNESLARHYGIGGVTGTQHRKVSLEGSPRAGLLTQGAILTVTSNPTRTSPVKRGKWVLEQILGTPPPPPPPDVGDLREDKEALTAASLRKRMEQHRKDPVCASCHQRMDPIGFGLENFDGVGAWRETDGPHKIDPSGELPGGARFRGPMELIGILKGRKGEFTRSLSEKLLIYATGRGLEPADDCHVDTIAQHVEKNGYRFSELVSAVVMSEPFRFRSRASSGK